MKTCRMLEQTAGFVIEIADGRGRIMYCMLIVDDEDQERLESNLF